MAKAKVVQLQYDLLKEIIKRNQHFPRRQQHMLGDRLQTFGTEILENLIRAAYAPHDKKATLLREINIQLEQLRFLLRMAYELGFYNSNGYQQLFEQVQAIGRSVGGWLKKVTAA